MTPQAQDVNWTYIRRSEDVLDVFWTSYVRSIYVLCLWGNGFENLMEKNHYRDFKESTYEKSSPITAEFYIKS